jgi:beta-lactamase class C
MHPTLTFKCLPVLAWLVLTFSPSVQASPLQATIKRNVDHTIQTLMQQYQIPGMSIAITADGHDSILNYGVASIASQQPVSGQTLFEIGSVSKTFAATLASLAQLQGKLAWSDSVSQHLPALRATAFDQVTLLNLATHTSGLPMLTPDSVTTQQQLYAYLKAWQPPHAIGSHHIYSNNGIGLLGQIAAQSLQQPYETALERRVLRPLGMNHTYITVPSHQQSLYAQGYSKTGQPMRMHAGMLSAEAYGIKTSSADLLKFLKASITADAQGSILSRAMANTQHPYFDVGEFQQALIWDRYSYPVDTARLMQSNYDAIVQDLPASRITQPAGGMHLLDKTGSTNGFSTYMLYVPQLRIGVVLLANKSYPLVERVKAGKQILTILASLTH